MDLQEEIDIVHCDVRRPPLRSKEKDGLIEVGGAVRGAATARAAFVGSAPLCDAADAALAEEEEQHGEGIVFGAAGTNAFDTALMNPPFGTRQKGVDMAFLRAGLDAVRAGGGAVYSMHKTSTRDYIAKTCKRW